MANGADEATSSPRKTIIAKRTQSGAKPETVSPGLGDR